MKGEISYIFRNPCKEVICNWGKNITKAAAINWPISLTFTDEITKSSFNPTIKSTVRPAIKLLPTKCISIDCNKEIIKIKVTKKATPPNDGMGNL